MLRMYIDIFHRIGTNQANILTCRPKKAEERLKIFAPIFTDNMGEVSQLRPENDAPLAVTSAIELRA